ncbi:polyprenyl diphosphate synthase [Aureimonas jatrophae]|uniref:Isoprenyl transferase n=1 Tax=Aureimonas jatrophae TaxID=1166073 RepID=A0A1H0DJJ2_9HYPH|nr:polyprenyl diphosphate synthase [Aureimonas jatrophae]MBB3951926.1 undecaprenyl diphosphate synthase [Aureimonas jatrophae]SDN70229.1 undecaprenyl diphosphate synthase [Aureimonas jatrophae]
MQSDIHHKIHLGIIMDGNGRWATRLGHERGWGHREGVRAIRPVVEAVRDAGVGTLTLYAFSSDNWRRPAAEVAILLRLLGSYLRDEIESLVRAGIRLTVIGRRDRLGVRLSRRIAEAEARSAMAERLHLRIAFDYSSRDAIVEAARLAGPNITRDDFAHRLSGGVPDLDLLIRTGGEQRLSDFLLFESAYAELLFTPRLWPDFRPSHVEEALAEFRTRQRRFGALPGPAVAA